MGKEKCRWSTKESVQLPTDEKEISPQCRFEYGNLLYPNVGSKQNEGRGAPESLISVPGRAGVWGRVGCSSRGRGVRKNLHRTV